MKKQILKNKFLIKHLLVWFSFQICQCSLPLELLASSKCQGHRGKNVLLKLWPKTWLVSFQGNFENIAIRLFFNLNSFGIYGHHLVIVIINERSTDGWRLRMLAYQIARWAVWKKKENNSKWFKQWLLKNMFKNNNKGFFFIHQNR